MKIDKRETFVYTFTDSELSEFLVDVVEVLKHEGLITETEEISSIYTFATYHLGELISKAKRVK